MPLYQNTSLIPLSDAYVNYSVKFSAYAIHIPMFSWGPPCKGREKDFWTEATLARFISSCTKFANSLALFFFREKIALCQPIKAFSKAFHYAEILDKRDQY